MGGWSTQLFSHTAGVGGVGRYGIEASKEDLIESVVMTAGLRQLTIVVGGGTIEILDVCQGNSIW